MRRSDNTTDSLPYAERAGGEPPPSLATQLLFLQTKSSPTTLLSSGAQLKILRGCCEAMVCKSERCSGTAVTQWDGFGCHGLEPMAYNVRPLHDILTQGKLPFGFQSPHKLWKHWPVTNSDDVTWPVFTVKLWGIRADPITARPRVSVRASRLPVNHSPTSLDSKKQFEWDSRNAVQRRWGLSYHYFGILVQLNFENKFTKDQSSNWIRGLLNGLSAAAPMRPHWPQKAAAGSGTYSQSVICLFFFDWWV